MEGFAKVGVSSSVGLLLGLIGIAWIEPTTPEGKMLLIAICIFICTVVGSIVLNLIKRPTPEDTNNLQRNDDQKTPKIWLPGDKNNQRR